jgi:PAS domain S-box-containing protein
MIPVKLMEEIERIMGEEPKEKCRIIEEDVLYLKKYSQVVASKLEEKVRELEDSLSDRVQIEQRLLQAHEFVEQIINSIPDPIFVKDRKHRFFLINNAFCSFTGHAHEELLGKSDYDFFPKEEADEYCSKDELVFNSNGTNLNEETLTDVSGKRHFIQTRKAPFVAVDGREFLIGVIRDITELNQSKELLLKREQEFRSLAENIPDNIVRYDREGRTLYVNPSLERTLGMPAESIIGKSLMELHSGGGFADYIATLKNVIATGIDAEIEMQVPDGADGFLHHQVGFVTERDSKGAITGILAIGRDITGHKQAEQALRDKQQRLSDMTLELSIAEERERRRIATNLHDTIGQDLALTRINLEILARASLTEEESKILRNTRDRINSAIKSVRHLTRLIAPPILESAGLEAALKWLGRQMEADYGLKVLFTDDLSAKPVSRDIQAELYFAARELLINSAKHANNDSARISLARENDNFIIRIADDGIGFDPDSIDANFTGEGGFGLLNIRRRIIHLGGVFEIESATGNGTRVTIGMPLSISNDEM